MKTIYLKLLRWMQSKCQHPDYAVKADLHEGDLASVRVKWCEICGSFRKLYAAPRPPPNHATWVPVDWRVPRPDYYTPKERKGYLDALNASR